MSNDNEEEDSKPSGHVDNDNTPNPIFRVITSKFRGKIDHTRKYS